MIIDSPGRYWEKVNKAGPVPEYAPTLGNCWDWTGALNRTGYGISGTHNAQESVQERGSAVNPHLKGDYPTDDFDAEMIAIIDAEIQQYDAVVAYEPSAKLYGPTTDMPWWIWKRVKEAILRHGAFRIIMAAGWDECFKTIERDAHIDWCVPSPPRNPFKVEEEAGR